jgi:hypothetical protein
MKQAATKEGRSFLRVMEESVVRVRTPTGGRRAVALDIDNRLHELDSVTDVDTLIYGLINARYAMWPDEGEE